MQEKWIQLMQVVAMAILPLSVFRPVPATRRRPTRRRLSRLMEL